MHRSPMITVSRGQLVSAAAQVLERVRLGGLVSRDELVAGTGLSMATVGRAVGQLTSAGLLRERPDRIRSGAVGRPGVPVELDPDRYVTLGIHLGRRITTIAVGDLTGRVLAHDTLRRELDEPAPGVDVLGRTAAHLLGGLPDRAPLAIGLVGAWQALGLSAEDTGRAVHEATGLDVRTGDHIPAVAATEFFHRRPGTSGVTLYVYARDTIGWAVVVDKGIQVEVSRVGHMAHLPTGSDVACPCGRTGCLEVTAGDEALTELARRSGLAISGVEDLYAAADVPQARGLLTWRARVLGEAAAAARDIVDPDRVVLVGQSFTGCPQVLEVITSTFAASATSGSVPVSFTRFGAGIQAITACTIGLGAVYDDPLALVSTHARAQRSSSRPRRSVSSAP